MWRGTDGARLAGAAGAEEEGLALGGEEGVLLPGVPFDALAAEDERGAEGHRQCLGGGEHGAHGTGVGRGGGREVGYGRHA